MYVIEVIPLQKGVHMDSLSYFSSQDYAHGTILKIPVKNREIFGIVTSAQSVSATKTALRAATFSLRKLPPQEQIQSLSKAFIQTAEELARYYGTSSGALLYTLLAPEIRNGDIPLPHTHHVAQVDLHTPEVIEAPKKERFLMYRSLVRETFAHSGSVLFIVPTTAEADEAYSILSPGIEERIVVLTSTMTKKQLREGYKLLEDFSKSKLIIATPSHSVLERHDITTTVIEHARTPYYKGRTRPYCDTRDVQRVFSRLTGRRLIFGDLLVRSEEEYLRREEVYQTIGETPKRIELPGTLERITMKDTTDGSIPFTLFSGDVIHAIQETKKQKRHVFLFAARRGLAPVVACVDCGYIFRSPESGAPYSLIRIYKGDVEERWFVCSTSGHRERAHDTCPECGSWRLRERGIGIQYVHDELIKHIPDTPIILFDHTTAGTYKKACFLRDKFFSTKGAIMLGTHMALPYLTEPVETSVIVNMDALYATPTWRLQEENFALLLTMRELTSGTLYIQTRTADDSLIKEAQRGAVEQFHTDELELRKTFNYPPFTTFIHLTWQGTKAGAQSIENIVKKILKEYSVTYYSAPPSSNGQNTQYGLIRISSKDWPDAKLVTRLRELPPSVRIVINPDRIV